MNANGTDVRRLTTAASMDGSPFLSPDSRRIVFTSNRDGNNEIYVMNVDGSGQTDITCNPARDGFEVSYP